MKNEKFEQILQKDEKILWSDGTNKGAYIFKNIFINMLYVVVIAFSIGFFSEIIKLLFFNGPDADMSSFDTSLFVKIFCIIFVIGLIFSVIRLALNANNTYFAITNKRIIKRSGSFNNQFVHYSLKNIGTCEVVGSIFDKKGKNGSATLIITVKDFSTNTDGNTRPLKLVVDNLNNAYAAYNLLSEQVEGNNESLRVKLEK